MLAAVPPPMTRSTTSRSSRIRFAPLPDPRRAVLITENGQEIPLQAWLEVSTSTPNSSAASSPVAKFKVLDDEYEDDDDKDAEAASIPAAVSLAALSCFENGGSSTPSQPPSAAGTMSRSNSEHSLMTMGTTPSGSMYSSPSTSTSDTGGTPMPLSPSESTKSASRTSFFGRFRKGSSASTTSTDSTDTDNGLRRWTSASSGGSLGFPLSRTLSAQSDRSTTRSLSRLNPFAGSSSSLASQGSNARSKKKTHAQGSGLIGSLHDQKEPKAPTKMLNGRVYGAKRHQPNPNQKNPFANVNTNPDFVEWGYGGMGSVKSSNVGGSVWGKVQSSAGDDADDGGGMEWVRKRREQREQEKREREEKDRKEAEQKVEETILEDEQEEEASAAVDDTPTIPPPNRDSGAATPSAEHVTNAVNVPAPPHAPRTHHTGSQLSVHTLTETTPHNELHHKTRHQDESDDEEEEDEQRSEELREEDEEEEDEDDEAERLRCMQSIGAGVEKVSRHKTQS